MLVMAVLIDTFLIRSVVVPAMMHLIGTWNWWPTRMPVPQEDTTVNDESSI